MTDTKFVLSKVKVNGEVRDLVASSDGDHTTVNYNGQETILNTAIASILDKSDKIEEFATDSEVRGIFNI